MKKRWKLLIFISGLFICQIITYYLFGKHAIKNDLLGNYTAGERISNREILADTAFVRDFYDSRHAIDWMGDPEYGSHHLETDIEFLKNKLGVKTIIFDSKDSDAPSSEELRKKYKLIYNTYTIDYEWYMVLFHFFELYQVEEVYKMEYSMKRDVSYHWVLFFYTKSFEVVVYDQMKCD